MSRWETMCHVEERWVTLRNDEERWPPNGNGTVTVTGQKWKKDCKKKIIVTNPSKIDVKQKEQDTAKSLCYDSYKIFMNEIAKKRFIIAR